MTNEEYEMTQIQLMRFAAIVAPMKLGDFVDRIERAEAIGPIIDPTLYSQAAASMGALKELANSLMTFQRAANKAIEQGKALVK